MKQASVNGTRSLGEYIQNGVIKVNDLAPGPYVAMVRVPAKGTATDTFTLTTGQTVSLITRLEPDSSQN